MIRILLLLLVLTAPAALADPSDVIHVCISGGKVIAAFSESHRCSVGGTSPTTKADPLFIAYRTQEPTQQQLDDAFKEEVLSGTLGLLVKAWATELGITEDQAVQLLRDEL